MLISEVAAPVTTAHPIASFHEVCGDAGFSGSRRPVVFRQPVSSSEPAMNEPASDAAPLMSIHFRSADIRRAMCIHSVSCQP